MKSVDIVHDAKNALPVPTAWRETLGLIAQAFNLLAPLTALAEIKNVTFGDRIIEISLGQIEDYPALRVFIGPKTWSSSIYIWEEGYWSLLIDLHVDNNLDEVSDLVFPVKVTLVEDEFHFDLNFIHVP